MMVHFVSKTEIIQKLNEEPRPHQWGWAAPSQLQEKGKFALSSGAGTPASPAPRRGSCRFSVLRPHTGRQHWLSHVSCSQLAAGAFSATTAREPITAFLHSQEGRKWSPLGRGRTRVWCKQTDASLWDRPGDRRDGRGPGPAADRGRIWLLYGFQSKHGAGTLAAPWGSG